MLVWVAEMFPSLCVALNCQPRELTWWLVPLPAYLSVDVFSSIGLPWEQHLQLSPSLELRPFKKASAGGTIDSLEPRPGPTQKPVLGCLRPNKKLGGDTAPPMSEEAA